MKKTLQNEAFIEGRKENKKTCLRSFFSQTAQRESGTLVGSSAMWLRFASSPDHLATASNSTGNLGEQAVHGQENDFSLRQHTLNLKVHRAKSVSTSDASYTANLRNSRLVMAHQVPSSVHSWLRACAWFFTIVQRPVGNSLRFLRTASKESLSCDTSDKGLDRNAGGQASRHGTLSEHLLLWRIV